MIRNRVAIKDLSVILAITLVATILAFEFDIYTTPDPVKVRERTIELDEALTVGGLLCLALLIFAIRRYREQKLETQKRIAAEQQARKLAFQDPLTGLANRRQFDEALKAVIASPPHPGASHAIFLLDLNGFKKVNDVYGHAVGDELLNVVARRLSAAVREGDLVARLGGDEFAVLSRDLTGAESATSIATRILHTLDDAIPAGRNDHQIASGIGIAMIPRDATTLQEALRKADVALYRAKSERRSALRFFDEEMDRRLRERDRFDRDLRAAVYGDQIQPHFQPIVDLRTKKVLGFEAIPRWTTHPAGEVPAERFVAAAAENGLIHELFERLLKRSSEVAAGWPVDTTLALDIYPALLENRGLSSTISAILEAQGLAPDRLELEVTESALVHDLVAAEQTLATLRSAGIKIVLDKFGAGYSSLYHLRNFKVDKIKIDRSFVHSLDSKASVEIVSALAGLAHRLGVTMVADGVEESAQSASLVAAGCEHGQGLLFGEGFPGIETVNFFDAAEPGSFFTAAAGCSPAASVYSPASRSDSR